MSVNYVLPQILDLDDAFSRTPNTIVFNDLMLDRSPEEVVDILCDISNDKSDSVATCPCEATTGNYYAGTKCRVCGQICESNLFGEIRNDAWLEVPSSIKGVLNPQVFRILSDWIGNVSKQPILKLILNMQLPNEPIINTPFLAGMGFNWFYDNFESVITFFLSSHPTPTGRANANAIKLFLEKTGSAIWCTKLPILSKLIQPITRKNKNVRYADPDIENLMKSIFTLRSVLLAEKMMKFSTDHIDRNFFRVYEEFINYTDNILKKKLPKKPSIFRKHVFGSRSHCSCRSVAVPITDPHDSDEVYLPWKLGIMVYKYHILSVLSNKFNMPVFKAYNRIMDAINIYDHDIDLIMQQLIEECPYKGLPILMNRNPSLRTASIQLLFVTRIKPALKEDPLTRPIDIKSQMIDFSNEETIISSSTSILDAVIIDNSVNTDDYINKLHKVTSYVEDGTIAVSPLIVKGPNLDFDGDEINIIPIFEMGEVAKFDRLSPVHRFISSEKLAIDGGDVTLSSQQYCIKSAWVNDPDYM
jgi:hypothetical protein